MWTQHQKNSYLYTQKYQTIQGSGFFPSVEFKKPSLTLAAEPLHGPYRYRHVRFPHTLSKSYLVWKRKLLSGSLWILHIFVGKTRTNPIIVAHQHSKGTRPSNSAFKFPQPLYRLNGSADGHCSRGCYTNHATCWQCQQCFIKKDYVLDPIWRAKQEKRKDDITYIITDRLDRCHDSPR